jgi:hypothetical protein
MLRAFPRRRTAALAAEAFVVTYPMVLMDLTRGQLTTRSGGGLAAPVNEFAHVPECTRGPFAPLIAPYLDTLTSSAWLDLSGDPLVLSVPDTSNRYYAMLCYDAWTSVFATIGTRTTGTREQEFVLVGPQWRGRLPRQLPVVQSPTSMAWILGHIRSDGPADQTVVQGLQARIRLTSLRRWERGQAEDCSSVSRRVESTPVVASSPAARIARMDPIEYFAIVARLLADNPPHRTDRIPIDRMSALGIVAGRPPRWSPADRPLLQEMARGTADGLAHIEATGSALSSSSAGAWICPQDVVRPTDPLLRAAAAWTGLGAWPRRDGLFFTSRVDQQGCALTGTDRYVLRFEPGARPPVRAFWSLTVHDDISLVIADPRRRPAVGDRDGLRYCPDGSIVVTLQPQPPEGDETNWLQTPRGPFSLALRLYWPAPPALDGSWRPPSVEPVMTDSDRTTGQLNPAG